jgi:hypothetical protein
MSTGSVHFGHRDPVRRDGEAPAGLRAKPAVARVRSFAEGRTTAQVRPSTKTRAACLATSRELARSDGHPPRGAQRRRGSPSGDQGADAASGFARMACRLLPSHQSLYATRGSTVPLMWVRTWAVQSLGSLALIRGVAPWNGWGERGPCQRYQVGGQGRDRRW